MLKWFIIPVVMLQCCALFWLIWRFTNIEKSGKVFLFKCELEDPENPFLGKYVSLNFKEVILPLRGEYLTKSDWIYVQFSDSAGFAKPMFATSLKPTQTHDYLRIKKRYYQTEYPSKKSISIYYDFDKFYMNEELAPGAEIIYRNSISSHNAVVAAKISIYDGEYLLTDVLVNGKSIAGLVKK